MGTWGTGIFEDDTILDYWGNIAYDTHFRDVAKYCEKAFDTVISIGDGYIDDCNGSAVAVCGAIVDSVLNGTVYNLAVDLNSDIEGKEQYTNWIYMLKSDSLPSFERMKGKAAQALTLLISENSELFELWADADTIGDGAGGEIRTTSGPNLMEWKGVYEPIIKRLSE